MLVSLKISFKAASSREKRKEERREGGRGRPPRPGPLPKCPPEPGPGHLPLPSETLPAGSWIRRGAAGIKLALQQGCTHRDLGRSPLPRSPSPSVLPSWDHVRVPLPREAVGCRGRPRVPTVTQLPPQSPVSRAASSGTWPVLTMLHAGSVHPHGLSFPGVAADSGTAFLVPSWIWLGTRPVPDTGFHSSSPSRVPQRTRAESPQPPGPRGAQDPVHSTELLTSCLSRPAQGRTLESKCTQLTGQFRPITFPLWAESIFSSCSGS